MLKLSVRIVEADEQIDYSIHQEDDVKHEERGELLIGHRAIEADMVGHIEDPQDEHDLYQVTPLV